MTCIVGLVDKGAVYMGGDSAATSGTTLTSRRDPKVFRNGDFVIGFAGSFRMGQLLAHSLALPAQRPAQDTFAFMVTDFVEAVRACLTAGGYEIEDGDEFMVGYAGRLFVVQSDYQVSENVVGYAAIGGGAQVALGALGASEGFKPKVCLDIALRLAGQWGSDVRAPFNFVTLDAATRLKVAA